MAFVYPTRVASDSVTVTVADRDRLEDGEFLNDSLVDCFLKDATAGDTLAARIHLFSSYFFTKMTDISEDEPTAAKAVERWTKKLGKKLFHLDFLFVPVNENLHWSLAVVVNPSGDAPPDHDVIDLVDSSDDDDDATTSDHSTTRKTKKKVPEKKNEPCILVFDSLRCHDHERIARYLRAFLKHEYAEHFGACGRRFSPETMPVIQLESVPHQQNSYDCGVFVLEYFDLILKYGGLVVKKNGRGRLHTTLAKGETRLTQDLFGDAAIKGRRSRGKDFFDDRRAIYDAEEKERVVDNFSSESSGEILAVTTMPGKGHRLGGGETKKIKEAPVVAP